MTASNPHCVLLAERHPRLSEGVRGMLETTFSQVFMVADQASLLEGAHRLGPALVVVDISFAEGRIEELLRALHSGAPGTRVLVLSIYDERRVVTAAIAAGADGYVLKRSIATDLLPAVDRLLAGRRFISPGAQLAAAEISNTDRNV